MLCFFQSLFSKTKCFWDKKWMWEPLDATVGVNRLALAFRFQLNLGHLPLCCTSCFPGWVHVTAMVSFKLLRWCHWTWSWDELLTPPGIIEAPCWPLGDLHPCSHTETVLFIKPCSVTIQNTRGSRTTEVGSCSNLWLSNQGTSVKHP